VIEVEMKFRVPDWAPVVAKLQSLSAVAAPPRKDTDHYFNAPDRDFGQTDEAVRIRRIGQANFLTYKGPKIDPATKSRTEIEIPLAEGPATAADSVRFLSALGYRPVAVVTKMRQVYRFDRDGFKVEACLDDVGVIGKFVELEIQAPPEVFDAAKATVMAAAADLGLTDQERRSYLRLLLEQTTKR
jgi:adenylate cyclase, class 2